MYEDPVDPAIWYRADTARKWVHEFRAYARSLPQTPRGAVMQHDFVLERLGDLPRLRLFGPAES